MSWRRKFVSGPDVIENDFHEGRNLEPNVCAVHAEEDCVGFYERYGREFYCMVPGDDEMRGMYIHR